MDKPQNTQFYYKKDFTSKKKKFEKFVLSMKLGSMSLHYNIPYCVPFHASISLSFIATRLLVEKTLSNMPTVETAADDEAQIRAKIAYGG